MRMRRKPWARPELEACNFFIDNPKDAQAIDTIEEQKAFGIAYAKGILKYFGINYQPLEKSKLVLTIGKKKYEINGKIKEIEVAPRIENGRTLVPIAVLRDLGLTVEWNSEKQQVTIIKEGRI